MQSFSAEEKNNDCWPNLIKSWTKLNTFFDFDKQKEELSRLKNGLEQKDLWQNPKEAKSLFAEIKNKEDELNFWEDLSQKIKDLTEEKEILTLMEKESQEDLTVNWQKWNQTVLALWKKVQEKETLLFFDQPFDQSEAFLTIKSGAGGLDAEDWAEMLLRMYLRFLEKNNFHVEMVEKSVGKEGGLKNVSLKISGSYPYGFLRGEHGIHRLVRLSPFNVAKSRETSFASVEVIPFIPEDALKIEEKDLKIETFRAGGPGGQHVNTTDSAVRITHLPTNLTASCQSERSQFQNKELALRILKAKIFKKQKEEKEQSVSSLRGEQRDVSFGSQIRSYVLHPYTLVKDHRSGYSVSNVNSVLDGEIEEFIKSYLRHTHL